MAPAPSSKPVSGHITLSKTPQSKPRLHFPSTKSMHPSPIPISAKKKPHKWTTLSKSSVRFVITQIWKTSPRQCCCYPAMGKWFGCGPILGTAISALMRSRFRRKNLMGSTKRLCQIKDHDVRDGREMEWGILSLKQKWKLAGGSIQL